MYRTRAQHIAVFPHTCIRVNTNYTAQGKPHFEFINENPLARTTYIPFHLHTSYIVLCVRSLSKVRFSDENKLKCKNIRQTIIFINNNNILCIIRAL